MVSMKAFYQARYTKGDYGAGAHDMNRFLRCGPWREWAERHQGSAIAMLDAGCGKGAFMRDLLHALSARFGTTIGRTVGIDLTQSPGNLFNEIPGAFTFMEHDLNEDPLPFEDNSFDLISCNHVLEHIFNTESVVRELCRVLKPGGLAVISVPNIATWPNRVALLFAGQPLGSEVGTETVSYGFWPGGFKSHLGQFVPSGHIRDFTPRSLRDLAEHCGLKKVGWWNQDSRALLRVTKWAGRGIGIVLTKS